jgi:hypothetical protein
MTKRWYRNAGLQIAAGFALLMLAMLAWSAFVPTHAQRCATACEADGKLGRLAPTYSRIQTGNRDGPSECACVSQAY